MKAQIAKFGFEVEGEFSQDLANALEDREYGKIATDGSIRNCPTYKANKYHTKNYFLNEYEFVSKPLKYNDIEKKTATKIFNLFNVYYKKKEFHWNESTGFHIHLSFNPKIPVEIWSTEFAKFFEEKLKEKFRLIYKTRKDNHYCLVKINEEVIANFDLESGSSARYSFINFVPAFKKHGTIEFRIFPANRPLTMKKYLKATFKFIEEFLEKSDGLLKRDFEFEMPEETKDELELEENSSKEKNEFIVIGEENAFIPIPIPSKNCFKVGDVIEALPKNGYSITTNYWRGIVIETYRTLGEMKVKGFENEDSWMVKNTSAKFKFVCPSLI